MAWARAKAPKTDFSIFGARVGGSWNPEKNDRCPIEAENSEMEVDNRKDCRNWMLLFE
jgi:hypothetical protein